MRDNIDVHKTKHRYELATANLKADKAISDRNRRVILKFLWDLQAQGIGLPRLLKYLSLLMVVARGSKRVPKGLRKDLEKATVDDLKQFVAKVNQSDYADWTKSDIRITLKKFFRWLKHLDQNADPPETAWIQVSNHNGKRILPEDLLTEDDIKKMLEVCETSRDRAFLLTVFETGGRIAEVLNLRHKHIQFDAYGAVILVSGKTGDRRVRLIASAPALAQWVSDHPLKTPDSPLWLNTGSKNHGEPLLYDTSRHLLKTLAEKAQVKKRVNPHSFRHARASFMANVLTESQMQQYFGWTQGSKMTRIYVHLSGKELDSTLLHMHGIETGPTTAKPMLTTKTCPRCKQKNSPGTRFCASCGLALEFSAALEVEKTRKEVDDWMNVILDDPEVQQLIGTKLKELMRRNMTVSPLPS